MAVKTKNVLTLADWSKRLDPNGSVPIIAELLNETNAVLDDMLWRECNDGDAHQTTIRTGIPEPTWRMLNYGVQPQKSTTAGVKDTVGMLEAYAEVDKELADKNGNTNEFRLSEAKAFIEGMSQEMAQTMFYGDVTKEPLKYTGFAPRYSTLNTQEADSAENVIDGGGTGVNNTSIWLVNWGENTTHGIFPKGSKVGLDHENLGQYTLHDANGGLYEGYRDHFKCKMGLTVRDWRYNGRICNLDVPSLTKASNINNLKLVIRYMIELSERVWEGGGTKVWYMNKRMRTLLRLAIIEKVAANLTFETVEGKKVMMFDGIPVKRVDRLVSNEQALAKAA
jgi:hypothetical protein